MFNIKKPDISFNLNFLFSEPVLWVLLVISALAFIASLILGFMYLPAVLVIISFVLLVVIAASLDHYHNTDLSGFLVAMFVIGLMVAIIQVCESFRHIFGYEDITILYDNNGKVQEILYNYNDEFVASTQLSCETKYSWFDRFTGNDRLNGCYPKDYYKVEINQTCTIGKDMASSIPFSALNNYAIYENVEIRKNNIYCNGQQKYPIDFRNLIKWN